jgi:hypothetical protein
MSEARVVIEDYRQHYNAERPHSSLGYTSPAHFAAKSLSAIPGSGTDRQAGPSLRPALPSVTKTTTPTTTAD